MIIILIMALITLIIIISMFIINIDNNTPNEIRMISYYKRVMYICLVIQFGWLYIILADYHIKEKTIILTDNWDDIQFSEIVKVTQTVNYIPYTTLQHTTTQIEILKQENN